MNPKLTLGQRLMADTPNFFKIAGYIGTLLIIAAAAMAYFHMPEPAITAVGSLGSGITVIAPFAVKDVGAITGVFNEIRSGDLLEAVPNALSLFNELKGQVADVKDALKQPVKIDPQAFQDYIKAAPPVEAPAPASEPAAPAPPAPIAKAEEVVDGVVSIFKAAKEQLNQPPVKV